MKINYPRFIDIITDSVIERRKLARVKSYLRFRELVWKHQDIKGEEFRTKVHAGWRVNYTHFEPRPIIHYKDVWHCPSIEETKELGQFLLRFPEIIRLELNWSRIFVEFRSEGKDTVLPKQVGNGSKLEVIAD